MEAKNTVILEQCDESSVLLQSVKGIVYANPANGVMNGKILILNETNDQQQSLDPSAEATGQSEVLVETAGGIEALCRVCANSNNQLIPIFEGEGVEHNLAMKIHKYLPIKVSESDTLPTQLCYHCAVTILAYHDIIEGCLEAERKLLQMQTEMQKVPEVSKEDIPLQETELEEPLKNPPTTEEIQEAEVMTEVLQNKNDESVQEELHSTNTDRSVSGRSLTTYQTLRRAINPRIGRKIIRPEPTANTKDISGKIPQDDSIHKDLREYEDDPSSSRDLRDISEVSVNIEKNTEKKIQRFQTYPCMHCDFTAKQKKLLQLHLCDCHPELLKNKKRDSSVNKESIEEARIEVDGKVYYHCKDCGKNLYSPYTFSWHMRIHTGERPFTCHLCGKQFRVNQGLARHLKETHAGIKNFPCDICNRMFATKRNADDHRRIHTGERPYVCNVCGKAFKQKASLFVHNRTHTDIFPFKCNHCDQVFRTRPPLMIHITKHTGEKPHLCDICGRAFRIKYELKRHRLIHFDDKPWQCSDCGLEFKQKRYLVNHRRVNHTDITDESHE